MTQLVEVVDGDHRCFVVSGASAVEGADAWNSTLVKWLDHTPGVPADLIVQTGAQFGPYGVTLRVVDGPPRRDPLWEDVSELSIDVGTDIGVGELVDGPGESLEVVAGTYRLRVSARGRTEGLAREDSFPNDDTDEAEDEEPLEHYLLELWVAPIAPPEVIREDSQLARDIHEPPTPKWTAERAPGLEAAWALVGDLRNAPGARPLPGELDDLTFVLEFANTPVKLFNRLRYAFGWPPCRGGSGGPDFDAVGGTRYHDATLPEFEGAYDSAGHIVTTMVELTKPRTVVMRWNWIPEVEATPSRPYPLDARPRLLPNDSTVTINLAKINGAQQEPRTLVRLSQTGIPRAWKSDLEKLWTWHLVINAAS